MALIKENKFSQYRSDVELLVNSLNNGLHSFTTFVHKSTSSTDTTDEVEYISHTLKPIADKTKDHFDHMKKCGNDLLQKVNGDFERSTYDAENTKQEIRNMDIDIASLTEEMKGKEKEVDEAQRQCDTKLNNLRKAEDALSEARKKLDDAETARVATEAAGYSTAAACAVVSFFFPPALIGVVAGTTTGIVGSTALRDAEKACESSVQTAKSEVSSSENHLEDSKRNKTSTEQLLRDASFKKGQAQDKLCQKQRDLEELVAFQKDIIIMNENIKILYMNLSTFHGHFNVLHHETHGAYSISLLRAPTMTVCGSLSTLLTSHAIQYLCEPLRLNEMSQKIDEIQSVEWPRSIPYASEIEIEDFI